MFMLVNGKLPRDRQLFALQNVMTATALATSATPVTPTPASRSMKVVWEMVSKAALRSRRMRMDSIPESAASRRRLVILTRAVQCCVRRGNQTAMVPEGYWS